MFGYVLPDKPNMYMKDYALYKAFYCGFCHSVKCECGQVLRFSVNYDITFINILLHDLLKQEIKTEKKRCILNPQKKLIITHDELTRKVVQLNVLLLDFKIRDDVVDGSKKKFFARVFLRRKTMKARRALPEVASEIDICAAKQVMVERQNTASIDRAADCFAGMMAEIFRIFCKEMFNESIRKLAYNLGKYVYLMDALDDYDKDGDRGNYNALRLMYPDCATFKLLRELHAEDIEFFAEAAIKEIEDAYAAIEVKPCEGVITNVLWYGLRARAKDIMEREEGKCQKIRL